MIGDIGNMSPIDKHHVFLSSVLWSFTKVFKQAIHDVDNGTYGTHGYNLTLKNGISLLKTKYIKRKTWKAITTAKKQILSGKIKIKVTHNQAQVQRLIKGKG
jgi:simple sugar transport system substrate-binding protein